MQLTLIEEPGSVIGQSDTMLGLAFVPNKILLQLSAIGENSSFNQLRIIIFASCLNVKK